MGLSLLCKTQMDTDVLIGQPRNNKHLDKVRRKAQHLLQAW